MDNPAANDSFAPFHSWMGPIDWDTAASTQRPLPSPEPGSRSHPNHSAMYKASGSSNGQTPSLCFADMAAQSLDHPNQGPPPFPYRPLPPPLSHSPFPPHANNQGFPNRLPDPPTILPPCGHRINTMQATSERATVESGGGDEDFGSSSCPERPHWTQPPHCRGDVHRSDGASGFNNNPSQNNGSPQADNKMQRSELLQRRADLLKQLAEMDKLLDSIPADESRRGQSQKPDFQAQPDLSPDCSSPLSNRGETVDKADEPMSERESECLDSKHSHGQSEQTDFQAQPDLSPDCSSPLPHGTKLMSEWKSEIMETSSDETDDDSDYAPNKRPLSNPHSDSDGSVYHESGHISTPVEEEPPDEKSTFELSLSEDDDELESSKTVVMPTSKSKGHRVYDRRNYCLFCKKPQSKMSRHIERVHHDRAEVATVFQYPLMSQERRRIWKKLINQGNFEHNKKVLETGKGQLVAIKRPSKAAQGKDFLHCRYCHGLFLRISVNRHMVKCPEREKTDDESGAPDSIPADESSRGQSQQTDFQAQPDLSPDCSSPLSDGKCDETVDKADEVMSERESEITENSSAESDDDSVYTPNKDSDLQSDSDGSVCDESGRISVSTPVEEEPPDEKSTFELLLSEDDDGKELSEIVVMPSLKSKGHRIHDKKNYCLFCKKPQSKIARHIERVHHDRAEVATVFQYPLMSKERRRIWKKLINQGNFEHNKNVRKTGNGHLVASKRPSKAGQGKDFLHCRYCHGLFLRIGLNRHMVKCPEREKTDDESGAAQPDLSPDCSSPLSDGQSEQTHYQIMKNSSVKSGDDNSPDNSPNSDEDVVSNLQSDCDGSVCEGTGPGSVSTPMDERPADEKSNCELSEDDDEKEFSEMMVLMPASKSKGHRVYDKRNYCLFCQTPHSKLSRHFLRVHGDRAEVAAVSQYPLMSQERRRILKKLINQGNFEHNKKVLKTGKGQLVVLKRPSKAGQGQDYLHCLFCRGLFFRKSLLNRHMRKCPEREKAGKESAFFKHRIVSRCALEAVDDLGISDGFKVIVGEMTYDDVTKAIIKDKIILQFGQQMFDQFAFDGTKYGYIRQRLREVGRLLLEAKKTTPLRKLEDFFIPSNFEHVLSAVKVLAGFDPQKLTFNLPSLALKLGYHLQKVCAIVEANAVKCGDESLAQSARVFRSGHQKKWEMLISSNALKCLDEARTTNNKNVPLSFDVDLLYNHLENFHLLAETQIRDDLSVDTYASLAKVTLARTILSNRRKPIEVATIQLMDFMSQKRSLELDGLDVSVTDWERTMCGLMPRMDILGSCGRTVPVLLKPSLVAAMELLVKVRETCGVPSENPFLFGRPKSLKAYQGWKCITEFGKACGAKNPDALTARKLMMHYPKMLLLANGEQANGEMQPEGLEMEQLGATWNAGSRCTRRSNKTTDGPQESLFKGKQKWQKEEVQAVERHMMRFIQHHKVPQKNDCLPCLQAEAIALEKRSWSDLKNYIRNRITALKRGKRTT